MTTHELRITSRGPWDPHGAGLSRAVQARCTCGEWWIAWTPMELRRQNLDAAWILAETAIHADHEDHVHAATHPRGARAQGSLDEGFYA